MSDLDTADATVTQEVPPMSLDADAEPAPLAGTADDGAMTAAVSEAASAVQTLPSFERKCSLEARAHLSPQAAEALSLLEEKTGSVADSDIFSNYATPTMRDDKKGLEEAVGDYHVEPLLIQEERNRRLQADVEVRQSMSERAKRGGKTKREGKPQTTMLHRDIVELEGFGFVDKFFYQLWRSETGCARFSEPHLMIPHTVLFNCGQPTKWFFTSKQSATFGEFQKKKRKNATSPAIEEEFMRQRKNRVSDVIAYYVSGKSYKAGEFEQPKVEFLDTAGFIQFMSPTRQMQMAHNEELGFLQVFVDPKNNFLTHGRKNFVLRVKWTPHICLVNARVNQVELDPTRSKKSIFDRAATFEGNSDGSNGAIVSDRLGQFLKQVSTKIVAHLEKRSPPVELIELNFKIDDSNTVWLLNCSSLQFHSGGKISRVLLSPDIGQADAQGRGGQQQTISLCCQCLRCGKTFNNNYKCGVSFKQILLHHMAQECASAEHKEKSRPRNHRTLSPQSPLEPEPILELLEGLDRMELLGLKLEMPKLLQRADPRLTVFQLIRAIKSQDVEILYRVADVCSTCAQTIVDNEQSHGPKDSSLTGMSFSNEMEGTEPGAGLHDTAQNFAQGMDDIKDMPSELKNFVSFNSKQGGTTNKRRPHYAVDCSVEDLPDVSDATLDRILNTCMANPQPPQRAYLKPKPQIPDLAVLEQLPRPPEMMPWCPAGNSYSPKHPTSAPSHSGRRPIRLNVKQLPTGGAYGPVVLPASTRERDAFSSGVHEPQTAREVRDRLPLIESGGFRPPRIPLTARRSKQATSGPVTAAAVAQIAREVIAYDPSGITLQVDHAKEASRLEIEADRLMVEAKLHRVAGHC